MHSNSCTRKYKNERKRKTGLEPQKSPRIERSYRPKSYKTRMPCSEGALSVICVIILLITALPDAVFDPNVEELGRTAQGITNDVLANL